MPILEVEIVGTTEPGPHIVQLLADSAAAILKSGLGNTWVKLRTLLPSQYAENGGIQSRIQPVFVSVLMRSDPDLKEKGEIVFGLTSEFSRILARLPEDVHILFEPEAAGRIAFGGSLVPPSPENR